MSFKVSTVLFCIVMMVGLLPAAVAQDTVTDPTTLVQAYNDDSTVATANAAIDALLEAGDYVQARDLAVDAVAKTGDNSFLLRSGEAVALQYADPAEPRDEIWLTSTVQYIEDLITDTGQACELYWLRDLEDGTTPMPNVEERIIGLMNSLDLDPHPYALARAGDNLSSPVIVYHTALIGLSEDSTQYRDIGIQFADKYPEAFVSRIMDSALPTSVLSNVTFTTEFAVECVNVFNRLPWLEMGLAKAIQICDRLLVTVPINEQSAYFINVVRDKRTILRELSE